MGFFSSANASAPREPRESARLFGVLPTSESASFVATSCKIAGAQTASTRPSAFAFAGRTLLPVSARSMATRNPARAATRSIPFAAGMRPSFTSGRPITVFPSRCSLSSVITMAWHASASSKPPPSAGPCIAATNGLSSDDNRTSASASSLAIRSASVANFIALSMSMFAPTTKLSFLPLTRTAATMALSDSIRSIAAASSMPSLGVIVLSGARGSFKVTNATPPSITVTSTILPSLASSRGAVDFPNDWVTALILPPPRPRPHQDHPPHTPSRARSHPRVSRAREAPS